MRYISTTLIIFITVFSANAQKLGKTTKNQSINAVKNIVVTEETYNKLTSPTLNKRKLSKIADRNTGKPQRPDNPIARRQYELEKLKNPFTGTIPANIRELEKAYVLSSGSKLQNRLKAGGLNFIHTGPINVGGRTRALALDISDPTENTIIAGGTTGGMWKSADNGASWTRTTELDDHPSVTAIAQDPRPGQTSTWYYTTGEMIGSASDQGAFYTGNGVFKSTDNGDSWTQLSSTAANTFSVFDELFDICWNICVDPNNGDVYVAAYGAIFVSKDGGNTWAEDLVSFNDTDPRYSPFTDIICTPAGVKYATISSEGDRNSGVWRKGTGANAAWVNLTPNGFPPNYRRMVLARAPSNTSSDVIYLLAQTPDDGFQGHSFWKLIHNASPSWFNRSQNLPERGGEERDVNGYSSQSSYNMVVKVAPDDENMVFLGGTNLFRSNDGFATNTNTFWIGGYATENDVSQYLNHHPDMHSMVFKSDNTTLICGHDGGLSITSNLKKETDTTPGDGRNIPVDWQLLNNGYLTTQAYTIAIDHDITSSKFMLTGFQDNGTWLGRNALPGTNWQFFGSGDGSYCSILNFGEHFLSSSQNGVVFLETDPDAANYVFTRVDPEGTEGQLFINPFIVDANSNEIMYYAGGEYVWRNSNIFEIPQFQVEQATKNWERLDFSKITGSVSALESSTFPAHILYYGTSRGEIYKIENSHLDQATVTEITGNNMPTLISGESAPFVSSIDVNPLNADEIMVSFSNYGVESIFYSNNGGTSWAAVSGNLEDGSSSGNGPSARTVSIVVSPTDTTYYAGTSTGLYSTSLLNGSSTVWTQEAINQIGTTVVDMVKARRDGFIAAATHGNGVFTTDADYSASAPVALIGITKNSIQVGEPVNFMNRSIGDGITTWEWSFEGAETTSSSDEHPRAIVYNIPGTYDVSLRAVNSAGENTQFLESAITVKSVSAEFTASATNIEVGDAVTFTDQSTGNPISWNWSFPGGAPSNSTEQNPVVTYNTTGTFDVSLTVDDGSFNDTENKPGHIVVTDPDDFEDNLLYNVQAQFEDSLSQFVFQDPNSGYVTGHNEVQLTDGSSVPIEQYAEKFTNANPNLNAVKKVHIAPSVMQSNSANPQINLKIWNGSTEPTELVYQKAVSFSELTAGQFNVIDLAYPVEVGESFFVGYEVLYENPVDTFAVFHLPLNEENLWDNTAYLEIIDEWFPYSSPSTFGANTSLAIKALIGFDPNALGVEDELADKTVEDLLIYPNPMVYKTNVEFPNSNNQKYRLLVIDVSGRVVRIIENITGNNVIINREQLKPGLHIINLSGEKIYKGKLIVR